MRNWKSRIEAAFASTLLDRDILEELAQHAESTYHTLRADGVEEADAEQRVDALIAGWRANPEALRRTVTRSPAVTPPASTTSMWAAGAVADALYALRLLQAQPGAAAVTILTIALGVGAVTTLFSVANGVLLRPLPWANADGLIQITETRGGRQGRIPGTILNGTYLSWASEPQTIDGIGSYRETPMTLTGAGEATRINVAWVTPSMLDLLNAPTLRGRRFEPQEGAPGGPSQVILSQALWEQRFGARDSVLGEIVHFDGRPHTIVGVLPRSFRFPTAEVQAWSPFIVPEVDMPGGGKRGTIMRALARLKPGVTLPQAAAEGTARAIAAPDAGGVGMALFGAKEPIQITVQDAMAAATAEVRPAIVILLVASVLLFATAVANVANMQLARATARHRELTIRAALGAGTARLARQLLIESAVIGAVGSIAGLLLAWGLHAALPALLPAGFPRADAIVLDTRVLAVTLLLSAITIVACGVLPLLHARRLDISRSLNEGTLASAGSGRGRLATVRVLIVGSQVAVTCILVVGAVLLSRSFMAQLSADRGYDPANLLTASVPLSGSYSVEQRAQALDRILGRLRGRPGITHAAMSTALPLASSGGFTFFKFNSALRGGAEVEVESIRRVVTADYFGALGIRLRAGRVLTDADNEQAPVAIVVNRSFARKYFDDAPLERVLGQSLGLGAAITPTRKREAHIVGVVDDVTQDGPDRPPQPEMFITYAQLPGQNHGSQSFIVMRTLDDPAAYVEALRTAVREEDPAIALEGVMTMDQRIGESASRPRTYAVLLAGFAVFALLIAGAGLFGVLSHSVTQRSRELAVRTALGASRAAVVGTALKQMSLAMAVGLATGLAVAAALSNQLAPFVYGVSTRDWLSFGVAPAVLAIVGVIACVVPARRVARTDPVAVLREI